MPWSSIVASADDATFSDKDTAYSSFHAVAPLCSEGSEFHEILVPVRPQSLFIGQIERLESSMQFFQ
jgi:hypothetical protein